MTADARLEMGAAVALLAICAAFVASFVLGLGRSEPVAAAAGEAAAPVAADQPSSGRIEVLNASGRSGMARHVTSRLRNAGFDVVFFGNAPATAGDSSVVLDRIGDDRVARAAARALAIGAVRTQRDTTLYLDATVIVGRDWAPADDEAQAEAPLRRRTLDWLLPGR